MTLIEDEGRDYHLDERTREVGRLGVAAAREALRRPTQEADRRHRRSAA